MGNALPVAEERRSYRRLSDAIAMHIDVKEAANQSDFEPADVPDHPTHVVSLSPSGMKFYHTEPFEDGTRVSVTMRLFPKKNVLELDALVLRAGEDEKRSKNDRFFASLAFENVSEDARSVLLEHIEQVARQSFGGAIKLIN